MIMSGPGYGGARDEGRIGILFAALLGIVLALLLVFANISAVHVQHRRALACADALALAGVGVVDGGGYFCPTCGGGGATDAVFEVVQENLHAWGGSTCRVGQNVSVEDVQVVGEDVHVRLRVQSDLPFLPPVIGDLVAPVLDVSGKAQVYDRL